MGVQAEDRVRGALLAGLAVAVLAVGGWWWRGCAPATGPVTARTEPTPASGAPLDRLLVTVDSEDGRVLPGPEETLVLHQEPDGRAEVPSPVWVERSHLDGTGPPLVRQTNPSAGERHLLLVGCTGPGKLTVSFSGTGDGGPGLPVDCTGAPTTVAVTAAGGPLQVRFVAAGGGVDLDARLSTLS
ncbi:hypothetical protein MRQ36_11070 [Micromonospora sp. R77]|uniref:hypothetical protein n=1 Tax=Micromonospora sp. R77 TaxID=2925836 RepID=UPI001F610209|nr:hypothetical protein [Micromonospora sp. R77]MCI4063090.1 hypothetical protein [Micromonospora sp. R77]